MEEIEKLKAECYDLLLRREEVQIVAQKEVQSINEQIAARQQKINELSK